GTFAALRWSGHGTSRRFALPIGTTRMTRTHPACHAWSAQYECPRARQFHSSQQRRLTAAGFHGLRADSLGFLNQALAGMVLLPKPLDLRLERGFDRPVRHLNRDHARPSIGDTASLADALDLRTSLREFASAQD